MIPTFINRHEHHVFRFNLGASVHQGLRYERGVYVFFFSTEDSPTAFDAALEQGKLGDHTIITRNGAFNEVWLEVKSSTCPYWDIINEASLAEDRAA